MVRYRALDEFTVGRDAPRFYVVAGSFHEFATWAHRHRIDRNSSMFMVLTTNSPAAVDHLRGRIFERGVDHVVILSGAVEGYFYGQVLAWLDTIAQNSLDPKDLR